MRKIIIVCALFFVLSLLCSPSLLAQEESWSLVGTWINKAYDIPGMLNAKIVYGGDGHLTLYKFLSDTTPTAKATFTIEDSWTEKGIRWFKVKILAGNETWYEIDKLTEGGNTYESVFRRDMYPSSFDAKSSPNFYGIRYRE
jgi:hypothetical protein